MGVVIVVFCIVYFWISKFWMPTQNKCMYTFKSNWCGDWCCCYNGLSAVLLTLCHWWLVGRQLTQLSSRIVAGCTWSTVTEWTSSSVEEALWHLQAPTTNILLLSLRQWSVPAATHHSVMLLWDCPSLSLTFQCFDCLQCFDAVGWAAGRISGL